MESGYWGQGIFEIEYSLSRSKTNSRAFLLFFYKNIIILSGKVKITGFWKLENKFKILSTAVSTRAVLGVFFWPKK